MGAAEDRADIAGARPQVASDLAVVVAVVVAEDECRPGIWPEVRPTRTRRGHASRSRRPGPLPAPRRRGSRTAPRPTRGTASRPNASPAQVVERRMADDPVEPGPQRAVGCRTAPSARTPERSVVRGVHGRLAVAQDRVGDAINVIGVVPVRPVDGLAGVSSWSVTASLRAGGPDPCITSSRRRVRRGGPAQANSRPPSRTSSIQARSRPMVVAGPCPGKTPTPSSRPVRRASESTIASGSPPGRSTRPQPPANRVSPLKSRPSSSASRQTEPSVWPGVCRTRRRISPNRTIAALGQLDRRHGRRDLERRADGLRVRAAGPGRAGGPRSRRRCARRRRRCRRCGPSGRGSRR